PHLCKHWPKLFFFLTECGLKIRLSLSEREFVISFKALTHVTLDVKILALPHPSFIHTRSGPSVVNPTCNAVVTLSSCSYPTIGSEAEWVAIRLSNPSQYRSVSCLGANTLERPTTSLVP